MIGEEIGIAWGAFWVSCQLSKIDWRITCTQNLQYLAERAEDDQWVRCSLVLDAGLRWDVRSERWGKRHRINEEGDTGCYEAVTLGDDTLSPVIFNDVALGSEAAMEGETGPRAGWLSG